ncbi:hypothetical protein PSTT_00997 [Puccinia striiformis]|uniref:DUF659 domain-containing protein n=1 Tax=Puccinia striiformis TaxID=27350 RepID=A0A2S4W4Z2_9BASI|nr:hypothetical protein PSTT_00997 [Puccinia striiformis]
MDVFQLVIHTRHVSLCVEAKEGLRVPVGRYPPSPKCTRPRVPGARHKNNTSTMSTSEPPDPIDNNQNNENESEDGDTNENEMENEDQNNAPEEDDETSGGRRQLTDEEELTFDQKDKAGRRMIAYPCKMCGGKICRPTHDTSCGNLNKHVATCLRKQTEVSTTKSLLSLGVTASGLIDPKEVPQLCAVWCAEAARPFQALVDPSHKGILHPTVLKHLPTRKAVSKDIHLLYSAIQDNYRSVLKAHKGALYLGVDAWQSPNGFDILGVVIYRLKEEDTGEFELEAMPLDFVQLCESHSGEYMALTVQLVVEKFQIQDKICGIVSDNATNNGVMVRELTRLKWPRFKGETQWIRCFAHILNLIVQGILRPFGTQKKRKLDDIVYSSGEEECTESQIRILARGEEALPIQDGDSTEDDSIDDQPDCLTEADIENASDEDDETDRYTSNSCKATLAKFRAIAKKLRFSPNSKATFVDICREKGCPTPHSIERDVRTRWNSTNAQLKSVIRCEPAILEWQRHKKYGLDRKNYVDESDFSLARDLVEVLNVFHEITLQVSIATSARLLNIVVFIDQVTDQLSTAISNREYPPALRNACRVGLKITNKYYSLTDSSPLYRIAILLHPSFRDEYFKMAQWEPEWIAEAIRLARNMWSSHYQPRLSTTPSATPTTSTRPVTGLLAGLSSAAAARGGNSSNDPLDTWLSGALVLDGNSPVNPLKWWIKQKRTGNTHGGLVDMALDVLSCPGE